MKTTREIPSTQQGEQSRHHDPMWTVDDLAVHLNMTKHMIYNLTRTKQIPCFRIGRQLRFDPITVREHLLEFAFAPAANSDERFTSLPTVKDLFDGYTK